MVKPLVIAVCIASSLALAHRAAAQRPEVRYEYNDRDFTWERRQLDTPPLPMGGQATLTRHLDYPKELRRDRIEGKTVVSVSVDPAGRVTAIFFSPRMDRRLEHIVRRSVLRCEWRPGRKNRALTRGAVSFPLNFLINAR
jgi:outer membrane biosynthesis protein TonB